MIRCAIVGAGAVVEDLHLPAFRGLPQVELAAVCEPDPERAQRIQRSSSARATYATFADMLQREPQLDFVDIATPAHTHYDLVRQALEAGLHVLVEKPLALDARQGEELARIAARRGRKLCVLQTYRFRSPMLRAQTAIADGHLGKVEKLGITCHWGYDPFLERRGWNWAGMGTRLLLYELGVHFVDLAVHYAGPVTNVAGLTAAVDETTGAVSSVSALLQHETGGTSVLELGVLTSSRFIRFDLYGSKSHARIKLFPESFAIHSGALNPLTEMKAELRRTADFVALSVAERVPRMMKRRALPHFRLISGFVRSLEHADLDPPVTAESAVRTLEALDALHDRVESLKKRAQEDDEPQLVQAV